MDEKDKSDDDKVETNSDAVFIGGYLPRIPARRTSGLSLRNTNPSGALAYISANVKSASICSEHSGSRSPNE